MRFVLNTIQNNTNYLFKANILKQIILFFQEISFIILIINILKNKKNQNPIN